MKRMIKILNKIRVNIYTEDTLEGLKKAFELLSNQNIKIKDTNDSCFMFEGESTVVGVYTYEKTSRGLKHHIAYVDRKYDKDTLQNIKHRTFPSGDKELIYL